MESRSRGVATLRIPFSFTRESPDRAYKAIAATTGDFPAGSYQLQIESSHPSLLLFRDIVGGDTDRLPSASGVVEDGGVDDNTLAEAAAAWPDLPAPDPGFAAFVRDRILDDSEPTHVADLWVAYHAGRGHPVAIAAVTRMLDALREPLRVTGAEPAMIDELLSELPADLVGSPTAGPPKLYGYAGRGPLAAWLRVIAVRTLIKRRRRDGRSTSDDALADLASPELGPELVVLRQRYAAQFRAVFAETIEKLDLLERTMLRQHHLDGLGLEQLARLHGFSRATAVRKLAAARGTILAEVRKRLLSELGVTGATVDSIIRLVRGEVDLSLERYL